MKIKAVQRNSACKEELALYLSFHIKQLENWIKYMKKALAVNGYQTVEDFDILLEKQNK